MKILIVEDDVNYRYAIKAMLKECGNQIDTCQEAISGRQALDFIQKQQPDILLTDISMPEMNGIELIKTVTSTYPYIYILVLSAYDDFSFVKDALTLGAKDYILKYEMDEEMMRCKIQEAFNYIEKEKIKKKNFEFVSNYKDHFFYDYFSKVVSGKIDYSEKAEECIRTMFPGLDLEKIVLCGLRIFHHNKYHNCCEKFTEILNTVLNGNKRILHMNLEDHTYLLLGNFPNTSSAVDRREGLKLLVKKIQRAAEKENISVAIAISEFFSDPALLSVHFRKIQNLLQQSFFHSSSCILEKENKLEEKVVVKLKELYKRAVVSIQNMDDNEVYFNIDSIFQLYTEYKPNIKYVIKMYSNFIADYLSILHKYNLTIEDVYSSDFFPAQVNEFAENINELKAGFILLYDTLKVKTKDTHKIYRKEIREIIEYIEQYYYREITLEEIAYHFGYSPNYLCTMFKNETGERLFRCINKIRIQKAMKLIETTNMKVYEIADKTGFKNSSYFSQTFKAITGKSILEYKKT